MEGSKLKDMMSSDPILEACSSPKQRSERVSRRAIEKRVVKVPIRNIDDANFNKHGEYCSSPPSDSWSWRKYGQKPIKGSPYPRGYYRCSSSKGCPAKKQVERSKSDPSMLLVTYSYHHNHSYIPVTNSRSLHHKKHVKQPSCVSIKEHDHNGYCESEMYADMESMITTDDFAWTFSDLETTSSAIPVDFSRSSSGARAYSPMREEDESLFADLGELPECSLVFTATPALDEDPTTHFNSPPTKPSCRTAG